MASRSAMSSVADMEMGAFERETMSNDQIISEVYQCCGFSIQLPLIDAFSNTHEAFYGHDGGAAAAYDKYLNTSELPPFFFRYRDPGVTYRGKIS